MLAYITSDKIFLFYFQSTSKSETDLVKGESSYF